MPHTAAFEASGVGPQLGADASSSPCRVLLVDGNPAGRRFMARVVRRSFATVDPVQEAGTVHQARQILGLDRGLQDAVLPSLRLVLCDLELPDGSGVELFADLRNHPCRKVVLTLQREDRLVILALREGADGYLLKQEPCEQLSQELQRLTQGQPALSAWAAQSVLGHVRGGGPPQTQPPGPEASCAGLGADGLSRRETDVLRCLSQGLTIAEMAQTLHIRWFTVNDHLKSIYRKLGVSSRAQAAVKAARAGLV